MDDLKPCPFCGSKDVTLRNSGGVRWAACRVCDAEGGWKDEEEAAVEAWNNRARITVDQAIAISRLIHDQCKDVPHDIGLQVAQLLTGGLAPAIER